MKNLPDPDPVTHNQCTVPASTGCSTKMQDYIPAKAIPSYLVVVKNLHQGI
jgi:hypothetical protein